MRIINKNSNPKYELEETINKNIGQKLKERRKFLKMTQQNLAKEIGCTFQQIQKYEAGINKVSLQVLLRLCEVLKCPLHYFLGNFYFADSQSNTNCDIKTNLSLDNLELQLVLNFRQILNNDLKISIVNLIQNILNYKN